MCDCTERRFRNANQPHFGIQRTDIAPSDQTMAKAADTVGNGVGGSHGHAAKRSSAAQRHAVH